jgi:hypothetical protein
MKKAGEPLTAAQIAEAAGLDKKTVDTAMAELKVGRDGFAQALLLGAGLARPGRSLRRWSSSLAVRRHLAR